VRKQPASFESLPHHPPYVSTAPLPGVRDTSNQVTQARTGFIQFYVGNGLWEPESRSDDWWRSNQHPSSPLWLPHHQPYVSTTPLPGVPDTFSQVTQINQARKGFIHFYEGKGQCGNLKAGVKTSFESIVATSSTIRVQGSPKLSTK
jgi:hypothetical protein